MKYYKLIKYSEHYPSYESNKIYPEGFAPKNNLCDVGIHYRSNLNNGSWIEVPAGEYYVQEGAMPEYFAIKRVANNPLWQKYIDWLSETYGVRFADCNDCYYGYDGISGFNGINYYPDIILFENNPIELTLKQWDKIINKTMEEEFELPEKWCVRIDKQEVVDYCNVHGLYPPYKIIEDGITYAHFPGWNDCTTCNGIKSGYTEITYSQFIKYVLNKEVMEENKEIIGWKLKADCEKYRKVALQIMNDYNGKGSNHLEERADFIGKDNITVKVLKEAGVLGLWFEPVYGEKTLRFGGYDVTFEKVTSGVRISCNGETGTLSQLEHIYNKFKADTKEYKFGSRMVVRVDFDGNTNEWTSEAEVDPDSIKIGCTTGTWSEFVAIYEKSKSML